MFDPPCVYAYNNCLILHRTVCIVVPITRSIYGKAVRILDWRVSLRHSMEPSTLWQSLRSTSSRVSADSGLAQAVTMVIPLLNCIYGIPCPGTHNQNLQVYDVSSLQHVCSLSGHIGIVTVIKVSESSYGQYMFSGSSDTTVQVCEICFYQEVG